MKVKIKNLTKPYQKIYKNAIFDYVGKYRRGSITYAILRNKSGSRVDINIKNIIKIKRGD